MGGELFPSLSRSGSFLHYCSLLTGPGSFSPRFGIQSLPGRVVRFDMPFLVAVVAGLLGVVHVSLFQHIDSVC